MSENHISHTIINILTSLFIVYFIFYFVNNSLNNLFENFVKELKNIQKRLYDEFKMNILQLNSKNKDTIEIINENEKVLNEITKYLSLFNDDLSDLIHIMKKIEEHTQKNKELENEILKLKNIIKRLEKKK